ncbi:MAG: trigger factor [Actinomycetales bacterium]|nr:MAG: trigger factor [Actinomycetales bacterium]
MKSALETLNPTRVKLTVEVPYEELKPSLDAAYKSIGQQIQVPGFRRGKVPAQIIDQRLGKGAVLQEAINDALPKFYGDALREHELRPLSQPDVDVTEVPLDDQTQLVFTAELERRPDLELPDFTTLAVSVDPITVTDEDVDERLTALRERFGTLNGVERPVQTGDFVSIDLSATIGDETIDEVSGVSYEVGAGNMLEGMDEALVGLDEGATTTFSAPLAGGDHEGEQAECTVTVQSVKERELPPLDDDFAQLASEFDSLDELRADIVADVERAHRDAQAMQAREKLLDAVLAGVEVPVPESLVEAEVQRHLEAEDKLDDDEHRAEVDAETRKGMATQFVLDAIAEQEKVEVGQGDLIELLVSSAAQYGMDPNQFAQALDAQGQIPAMVGEVARRKALAVVLERATVTDTDGNVLDLTPPPAPQDSDGESDADANTDADVDAEPVTETDADNDNDNDNDND